MRVLHTSDWHLGASLEHASRDEEHERFLEWMLVTAQAERVDVLLVAGDIFDHLQPSAEAQRMYYRFLARARETGWPRKVVIVAGNHDSPSRLEAPKELLHAIGTHVVGSLRAERESWRECLCPVRGPGGDLEAVVLATPFVHEIKLGIRSTDEDAHLVFEAKFRELYAHLCDLSQASYPGLPILATGHLACGIYHATDAPREIHRVGQIGALPPTLFDPRLEYIALGHIHRMTPVASSRAWYSGTPVPISFSEAETPRHVLLLDLDGETRAPRAVQVPRFRELVTLEGSLEEVVEQLDHLSWASELEPFVGIRLHVERHEPRAASVLHDRLTARPPGSRPVLVELREIRPRAPDPVAEAVKSLSDLRPIEVFERLCATQGQELDAPLRTAFEELVDQAEHGQEAASP